MRGTSRRRVLARRWMSAAVAVTVAAMGLPAVSGASAGASSPASVAAPQEGSPSGLMSGPPDVLPPDGRWTVTLLTGEVIDVGTDDEGRVTARVREHDGPFRTVRRPDGELHVIPLAVTGLLDGVLDPELFNVTGLVRQGYDDAGLDAVPLIVERAPGADVAARMAGTGEQPLPSIGAVAVDVPKADTAAAEALIDELAAASVDAPDVGARSVPSGVRRVWLDRRIEVTRAVSPASASATAPERAGAAPSAPGQAELDRNLTQIGADDAWAAGFTGTGATVAVLDSGVDASHPDLADRIDAMENFGDSPDAVDHHGHGTHVASLAVGTGAAAGGARRGVAPDARLISGKVVDDLGFGHASQAIMAMEWAAPQADVVNMSLGYGTGSHGDDPISMALDNLAVQHGTLFVVAAGNAGPYSGSVEVPSVADQALTVGAVDDDDVVADFSSRGPAATFELKPEIVAPGVDIVAARADGTDMGDPAGDAYTAASGTSMAAPQVAGAAALLAQQHPGWDVDELKNTLIGSSTALDDDGYDVGAGRLDVGAGVAATLRPARDAVEASLPEPRTTPHSEVLTWINDGAESVTVSLDAVLEDREGLALDAVRVEPAELTVAPGATATATLAVDAAGLEAGLYTGAVTASAAGQVAARTPVAVHAAPETAELTVTSTPPGVHGIDGRMTFASIVNLDDFAVFYQFVGFVERSFTVEVPVGRYAVTGDVSNGDPDEHITALVGDPDITIDEDTTVALDGTAAVPFDPTVEGVPTARQMFASAAITSTPATGTEGYPLYSEVYAWHPSAPLHVMPMEGDAEHFTATQTFRLQTPFLTVRAGDRPIGVTDISEARLPDLGETTYPVVDAGDGADLSGATGSLALVTLPADDAGRVAVTRRAADAGVGVVVFVDEQRRFLTLSAWAGIYPERVWGDVPALAAAGDAATELREVAARGGEVTVGVAPSEDVYDIVTPEAARLDPAPVVDRAAQAELATIDERFHRDPDGTGVTADRRYSELNLMNLDSVGPLPERRTSHVTPNVPWLSMAVGPSVFIDPWLGEPITVPTALSLGQPETYEPGSEHEARWLRRPQWPGPVGDIPWNGSGCQPLPLSRTADTMEVWLSPFQDRLDGSSCGSPLTGALTLEVDGVPVPEVEESLPITEGGTFPVPAEAADYRLRYDQEGRSPYAHRSSSEWTFRSAAPGDGDAGLLPLLVVGYHLPLDTLNRPTDDTATLTVRQVTGAEESRVRRVRAWTSTDGGATWRFALVHRVRGGSYRLRLPEVAEGTKVSLRVTASDAAGSTIDQTLLDAYTA